MLNFLRLLFERLFIRARTETIATPEPAPSPPATPSVQQIAWGAKVERAFCDRVLEMERRHIADANNLMACMAFETGRTFSPAIKNRAGSGAIGLIGFMPSTALSLGVSSAQLAAMIRLEQLELVERYFKPYAGRLHSLEDTYMAILWPAAVGKADDYVLFENMPGRQKAYQQNRGLDLNADQKITKREATHAVGEILIEGLKPQNMG